MARSFASIGKLWGSFVVAEQDYGNALAVQWLRVVAADVERNMLVASELLAD